MSVPIINPDPVLNTIVRNLALQLCATAFAYVHDNQDIISDDSCDACIYKYKLDMSRLIAWYKTLDTDLANKLYEDKLLPSVFGYDNFYKDIITVTKSLPQ